MDNEMHDLCCEGHLRRCGHGRGVTSRRIIRRRHDARAGRHHRRHTVVAQTSSVATSNDSQGGAVVNAETYALQLTSLIPLH